MSVSCECCALPGREVSASASHSSRGVLPSVVCLIECECETSIITGPHHTSGCCVTGTNERGIRL
jgi:hypothetical protein